MKNELMYHFIAKNGREFYTGGKNLIDARENAECTWRVDLTGAKYEVIRGIRVERTGRLS